MHFFSSQAGWNPEWLSNKLAMSARFMDRERTGVLLADAVLRVMTSPATGLPLSAALTKAVADTLPSAGVEVNYTMWFATGM